MLPRHPEGRSSGPGLHPPPPGPERAHLPADPALYFGPLGVGGIAGPGGLPHSLHPPGPAPAPARGGAVPPAGPERLAKPGGTLPCGTDLGRGHDPGLDPLAGDPVSCLDREPGRGPTYH